MNKFLKDESGVTAIEYGLIAAAMAAVLIVSGPILAGAIGTKFGSIATALK